MRHHVSSRFKGTIIVLAVLVTAAFGMTYPSAVLAAKPLTEYVDVVFLDCPGTTFDVYEVYLEVLFYEVQKDGSERHIGGASPACAWPHGARDADSMEPIRVKPTKWVASWYFRNIESGTTVCESQTAGTNFPATITLNCDPHTATLTIGTPRIFP